MAIYQLDRRDEISTVAQQQMASIRNSIAKGRQKNAHLDLSFYDRPKPVFATIQQLRSMILTPTQLQVLQENLALCQRINQISKSINQRGAASQLDLPHLVQAELSIYMQQVDALIQASLSSANQLRIDAVLPKVS